MTKKKGNQLVSSFVACDLFGVIVSRFAFLCSYISRFSQNFLETAVNIVGGIIEGDKDRFLILRVALLADLSKEKVGRAYAKHRYQLRSLTKAVVVLR